MTSAENPFAGLEPKLVWLHFDPLTRLARPSHGEGPAREFVLAWAAEHGFETAMDGAGNVVVRVAASSGREGAPVAILQAHLDMVCERDPGSPHDPAAGDIHVVRDGDWIAAAGTTLGADNGLGVAAALAAAEDPDLAHGPLELLLTVGEEDGLTGAKGLDASLLSGRLLINLDGTSSKRLTVGCAGSIRTVARLAVPPEPLDDGSEALQLVVSGGQGGHSGEDIQKGRANAISVLGRMLARALAEAPLRVVSLDGGKSRNAIPRDAAAVVAAPPGGAERVRAAAVEAFESIRQQFYQGDSDIVLAVTAESAKPTAWGVETSARALDLVVAIPVGLMAIDPVYGGSETSTSLGLAETLDGVLTLASMTRTSNPQGGEEVMERICAAARLAGAEIELLRSYPPWRPDPGSELVASASRAFERLHGARPATDVVHGGLECAVIGSLIPGLDMVSLGADIERLHAPGERVSITGTQRFYALLGATLDELSGLDG